MSGLDRHYDAELQELLDGRLPAVLRAEVESHLRACTECRRRLEAVRLVKRATSRLAAEHEPPAELAREVAGILDVEDRKRVGEGAARRRMGRRAAGVAAALTLLAVAAGWLFLRRPAAADLPSLVADDYRRHRSGELGLELETARPEEAEAMFQRRRLGFNVRVFDLAMMRYRVAGARVHRLSGRPSALFTYAGEGGEVLLCEMYRGRTAELPYTTERRVHDGIEFLVYRRDGVTLVFWQEGEVVCVLASDVAPEEVVALAFAKAMKV